MLFIPHIAIVSYSDPDIFSAIERADMIPVAFSGTEDEADKLKTLDGFIIGGELSDQALMKAIQSQTDLGKPLLGLGSGAKCLVETGLVPGLENNKAAVDLIEKGSSLETPLTIRLSADYQRNAFTHYLTLKSRLSLPIIQPRRFMMTAALQQEIEIQGLNIFQYCDVFDDVPDHALETWAALSNKSGNIMAMLPHPEKTPEGDAIFQSMRDYILAGAQIEKTVPLYYYPRQK